jgi:hypothetical protein
MAMNMKLCILLDADDIVLFKKNNKKTAEGLQH